MQIKQRPKILENITNNYKLTIWKDEKNGENP